MTDMAITLHPEYTIRFTAHAKANCEAMNFFVRRGFSVASAAKMLGLSASSGRRYFNGSYDFNPGSNFSTTGNHGTRKKSFSCIRLGAAVSIDL